MKKIWKALLAILNAALRWFLTEVSMLGHEVKITPVQRLSSFILHCTTKVKKRNLNNLEIKTFYEDLWNLLSMEAKVTYTDSKSVYMICLPIWLRGRYYVCQVTRKIKPLFAVYYMYVHIWIKFSSITGELLPVLKHGWFHHLIVHSALCVKYTIQVLTLTYLSFIFRQVQVSTAIR